MPFKRMVRAAAQVVGLSPAEDAPGPRRAGPLTDEDLRFADELIPEADPLGTPCPASIAISDDRSRLVLEYLPEGQTLENWKRCTTIVLLPAPTEPKPLRALTAEIVPGIETLLQRDDVAEEAYETFKTENGFVAYFQYRVGDEYVAGYTHNTPGMIMMVQTHSRPDSLAPEVIDILKRQSGLPVEFDTA